MRCTYWGMTLQEFMAARDLKDEELASPFGVSRSMVTKLRQRKARPSFDTASRIIEFAGGAISLHELAPLTPTPEPAR